MAITYHRVPSLKWLSTALCLMHLVTAQINPVRPGTQDSGCHVRAWVRSPDLVPGELIYGEVKVKPDGDCEGIASYELGLRFRERAAFKLPRADVEIPASPTCDDNCMALLDPLRAVGPVPDNFSVWDEHQLAMRNESFWVIKEQERVAFDIRTPLAVQQPRSVLPFTVLVPLTNFPAAYHPDSLRELPSYKSSVAEVEHRYEYFVVISFSNGTTADIACGHTSFVPGPIVDVDASLSELEPVTVTLTPRSDLVSDVPPFDVQVVLPKSRVVSQGSLLHIPTVVNNSSVAGTLFLHFTNPMVEYTWAKTFVPLDERATDDLQHHYTLTQLTAHASVHATLSKWSHPVSGPLQANATSQFDVACDVPLETFPAVEMYYAAYHSTLSLTFMPESVDRDGVDGEGAVVDEEDGWVPWTPEFAPPSGSRHIVPLTAGIRMRIHPSVPIPSSSTSVRIPLTHYLSPTARTPIFVDRSHSGSAELLASLERMSAAERDASAPLALEAAQFVDIEPEKMKLVRFSSGVYVGETWQRMVVENGVGVEETADRQGQTVLTM